MILLLGRDDINGLITMKEAVDAMEKGLTDWANNPELGALRRRVHAPSGARVTVHQGAPASASVTGLLAHCEQVVIHPEGYQTYAVPRSTGAGDLQRRQLRAIGDHDRRSQSERTA